VWAVVISCMLIGRALGEALSTRISVRHAKLAVIVISYAGGVAAILDGGAELIG
jgi:uncharacterized protein